MENERIIKRYTNRKLYDKTASRYITLQEVARLIRDGEDVKVVDNGSGEDLTSVTFAQIILAEEKRKAHLLSVPFLRRLIRTGEARVQDLSDRATRGIEALGDLTEKAGERVREVARGSGRAIEEGWSLIDDLFASPQKRLDAIRDAALASVDKIRTNVTVRGELERLENSLRSLEKAVARLREDETEAAAPDAPGGEQGETPLAARAGNGPEDGQGSEAGSVATEDRPPLGRVGSKADL